MGDLLTEKSEKTLDKLGMIISGVCVIHCLLTPIIVLALPWVEGIFSHEVVHLSLLLFLFPLAIFTFTHGYKTHKKLSIVIMGAIGISFISIPILIHPAEFTEQALTISGSIILIIAHYNNLKSCKCHKYHH
ncbi:MAG: MerC domain-containing protein [Bdellovibrionales bacterium]|jgi:hypothetical protein|nr:MerC domain-containing protein [Bdellovibrionales bacterium]